MLSADPLLCPRHEQCNCLNDATHMQGCFSSRPVPCFRCSKTAAGAAASAASPCQASSGWPWPAAPPLAVLRLVPRGLDISLMPLLSGAGLSAKLVPRLEGRLACVKAARGSGLHASQALCVCAYMYASQAVWVCACVQTVQAVCVLCMCVDHSDRVCLYICVYSSCNWTCNQLDDLLATQ